MKRTRFSEQQIITILEEAESGVKVLDLCRQHGMGQSTFFKWKSRYGGLEASKLRLPTASAAIATFRGDLLVQLMPPI